jgi:ribosomal protein S18 acetylase RimI-like enzyme
MRLASPILEQYIGEIEELYLEHLSEIPKGVTYFGIFDGAELLAVASVKCYSGHWYLRGCVVKPSYRGRGLQRQLMLENLEYLAERTDVARVSVFPDNTYSIRNIVAEGFMFEREKKLADGKMVLVYKRNLDKGSETTS